MDKIEKYYNSTKKINIQELEFNFIKDNSGKDIVEIYNKDKLLIRALYHIVGLYDRRTSIWYWAYAIDFANKNLTKKSNMVVDFGKKNKDNESLYFYTTTPIFKTHTDNCDIFSKILLYLVNGLMFFKIKKDDGTVEYIVISKIIEQRIKL